MKNVDLLTRLRRGPLRQDRYFEVAASAVALRVRIHGMRKRGYTIETRPVPNPGRKPGAEYVLRSEPVAVVCPTCGRAVR